LHSKIPIEGLQTHVLIADTPFLITL
jgi:hypothetical protein